MSTKTPPTCGTYNARRRHKRRGESCDICDPTFATLAPCGTRMARKRHTRKRETCPICDPTRRPKTALQPCGTPAAYRRHTKKGQQPCDPCLLAYRADSANRKRGPQTAPRGDTIYLIQEIEFLLAAGEGEARILQATGYQGRVGALKQRLHRHQRHDLITRILNPWELAA